jgi:hypothetical protein
MLNLFKLPQTRAATELDIDGWPVGSVSASAAEMFRAKDIDIKLPGRLTNDDLKDIGVASFGHASCRGCDCGACRCRSGVASCC